MNSYLRFWRMLLAITLSVLMVLCGNPMPSAFATDVKSVSPLDVTQSPDSGLTNAENPTIAPAVTDVTAAAATDAPPTSAPAAGSQTSVPTDDASDSDTPTDVPTTNVPATDPQTDALATDAPASDTPTDVPTTEAPASDTSAPVDPQLNEGNAPDPLGDVGISLFGIASSSTILASSHNPTTSGQAVTFTATVSAESGTPTGTVEFFDGAISLGLSILSAGGTAVLTTGTLTVGGHSITAVYGGDANCDPSTSEAINQTVNTSQTATTTTLRPISAIRYGRDITLRADIAGNDVTGSVSFYSGATLLGTCAVSENQATYTMRAPNAGSYSITAKYDGDTNNAPSTSVAESFSVAQASTSVASITPPYYYYNTSDVQRLYYGQLIPLIAQIRSESNGAAATGSVTFYSNGNAIGTANIDASGVAASAPMLLAPGFHTITAAYSGDANNKPCSGGSLSLAVETGYVTSVITSSRNPSTLGQSVTLTVKVFGRQAEAVTGTVTLWDGEISLGSYPISANGTASLTTSALTAGSHSIKVEYSGDKNHEAGYSEPFTQWVHANTAAATITTLSPIDEILYGSSSNLEARVVSANQGTPTGTISFYSDGAFLASAPVDEEGYARIYYLRLEIGTHEIVAVYNGDSAFGSSSSVGMSAPVRIVDGVGIWVEASKESVTYGSGVTLDGLVSTGLSGTKSGTFTFYSDGNPIATMPISSYGEARLPLVQFPVGVHTLTASYSGDASNIPCSGGGFVLTVNQCPTTTTVTSSRSGSTYTFTAQVAASASDDRTGTVDFFANGTKIGSAAVTADNTATFSTQALTTGANSIKATYGGDTNYLASTSPTYSIAVNQTAPNATTIVLNSSANPSFRWDTPQFSATVTPAAAGNVTFYCDGAYMATATLDASGFAYITTDNDAWTAALTAGTHEIKAEYDGSPNNLPASGTLTQTIKKVSASINIASSSNPSVYGEIASVSARTYSSRGATTDTIEFFDGSTSLGTYNNPLGQAINCPIAGLSRGTHSIKAVYSGNADFLPATTSVLTQIVSNPPDTTTTLTISPQPSVCGESIFLTATVSAPSRTPAGRVYFLRDGIAVGSNDIDASGEATLSISEQYADEFIFQAKYVDNDTETFGASVSDKVTHRVIPPGHDTATVTLASSRNPALIDQGVSITATVTADSGTPTGTVQFFDGDTSLGRHRNDTGTTTYTLRASELLGGSHNITAVYSGDDNFATATSAVLTQTINKYATTTALSSSLNPSTNGQQVAFTATVSSDKSRIRTGTVKFFDGSILLGISVVNASGSATLSTSALAAGNHGVTAVYSGDSYYAVSASAALTQVVKLSGPATTTTTVASSLNPSGSGQKVTFTAKVASPWGTPTGTVQFYNGSTSLGSAAIGAGGTATLATTALTIGSHSIKATYRGTTSFAASTSAVLTQVVRKPTSTTITATPNPSTSGQKVTFTAKVTAASGTPTGTVQFYDGSTSLGSVAIGTGGTATFATTALAVGSRSIKAVYRGNTSFAASTSAVLTQVVKRATSIAITAAPNPSAKGQKVTFTAKVTAASGTPTGTVQFYDGSTSLGSSTIGTGGTAALATTALTVGSHSIKAVYRGNTSFATSTSAVLTQVVTRPTSTTITATPNPSAKGKKVTFTAKVTSLLGAPAGTVQFYDGSTSLGSAVVGSGGIATFATTALTTGSHSMKAVYRGNTSFAASTSPAITQVVK